MDSARVDEFSGIVHDIWVAPLQLILCMSLLISNLGYSALVGFTVLIVGAIPGSILSIVLFKQRRAGMEFTDARMRLTTEVLQGIRVLKAYGWETFYAHQIETWRRKEVHAWKICGVAYAGLAALVGFIPIVAAILSFITYSLTNHDLNIAVIFSSLQLFNLILAPLETFSIALGSLSGAIVSFKRISTFLVAEELAEPYPMNADSKYAVDVDGDFTWEIAEGIEEKTTKESAQIKEDTAFDEVKDDQVLPVFATSEKGEELEEVEEDKMPYSLKGLKMRIQRGQFIAIVGRVGSGKTLPALQSSVLQALIGEMRKTSGNVTLGGTISYTPQRPWIRNATVRENILFGQPVDEARLSELVVCLDHDLNSLPQGEETEIGEKGINLSGGQKARVALARAAYSDTDIAILDDPISALDAHVGKAVLENCLLSGPLADRTRILVTHALHVLPKVDYIYVVENGQIVEQGTYTNLVRSNLAFARVLEEFGSQENTPGTLEQADRKQTQAQDEKFQAGPLDAPSQLMQEEERVTGAVTWGTYSKYFNFGGGIFWVALIIVLLLAEQTLYVAISLFLSFWTSDTIPGFTRATYMTVYGILGGVNALASFFVALSFLALASVLKSPIAFFDTTPMGRVVARFSKDQDVLDSQLPAALYHETSINTVERDLDMQNRAYYVSIGIQRWLAVRLELSVNTLVLGILLFGAGFRETVDPSKVALVLTYTLSGKPSNPVNVPYLLSFRRKAASLFTQVVDLFAGNEQNMNSVERLLAYTELLPEGTQASTLAKHNDPSPSWPAKGGIEFIDVSFAYRDGLPLVLRDVTFHVRPGEKIAIVGRTGSGKQPKKHSVEADSSHHSTVGKSSLLQALLRLTELCAGKITIDGVDALNVGLDVLRSRIAFVPQEGALFLGTLRENLDPHKSRTDVELVLILQRVGLLPPNGNDNAELEKKFSLDAVVGDEGQNYSAGERQLLSLCRALVKDSRIIVLDEATSNVDIETDAHIQRTIQTEWKESTLVCIAHRLNTIGELRSAPSLEDTIGYLTLPYLAYYDRVLVMDSGKVVDFDTVLSLFDKGQGIFRALCDEASLTREEVCKIRAVANGAQ
ncbi:hypothetical protein EYR36_004928 [Pleurotus pulmonarius]|nr:hypothetical protein EYR36_004928 [Pleurotus pulmonarius]